VPERATSLLFSANDSFFSDNGDPNGDFRLQIVSFKRAVEGAVSVFPGANEIAATFIPNDRLTLDQVAVLGGFDHFNWYQRVEKRTFLGITDPLFTPFTDPMPSGNPNQKFSCGVGADAKPLYYDEPTAVNPGCEEAAEGIDVKSKTNQLDFDDAPRALPGVKLFFSTSLVGVRTDGTWSVFNDIPDANFKWIYSQILFSGDTEIYQGLDESIVGMTEFAGYFSPSDFNHQFLSAVRSDGGDFHAAITRVSEPPTIALVALIFGFLLLRQRRVTT
jgi:hypothetical protein